MRFAWCDRAAVGWPDDILFVVWENRLTEGLAGVASVADFTHLSCDCDEEGKF